MSGEVGLGVDTANAMLNAFRHVAHDVLAIYVMMHTDVPGGDGSDAISVGDPSLKAMTFSAAAGGNLALATASTYTNDDTDEVLSHVSVWNGPDGPGTDMLQWTAELSESQAWSDGDTYTFDDFGLVLVPIASDDGSE